MSHFTQVKTKLTLMDRTLKAIKKLGFEVVTATGDEKLFAKGFMDNKTEALAVIKTGTRYDIGVVEAEDGTFEFTSDWELLKKVGKIDQEQFAKDVSQQYAVVTVEEIAKEQGLSLGKPVVAEDGSIELTVTQW